MRVKVSYALDLRRITSLKEEVVEVEGRSLHSLLETLAKEYGDEFRRLVFKDNTINPDVIVVINGNILTKRDVTLSEGDHIVLMPVIVGGYS